MYKKIEIPNFDVVRCVKLQNENRSNLRNSFLKTLTIITFVFAVFIILFCWFFPLEKIDGDDLSPKLTNNDICLCINQTSYQCGDLVCIDFGTYTLIKRIVGCEGDIVSFDDNNALYINGNKIDENYLINNNVGEHEDFYPYQVEDNSYFMLSDNREVMSDSRSSIIKSIDKRYIVGKVIFRFWPLDKIGMIE